MADEGKPQEVISLDIKEFLDAAKKATSALQGIGDPSNLSGLLTGLKNASLMVGAVGAAALALKATLDIALEGEQIRQINASFEALSRSFGVAGDKLKDGLLAASKGLIDDTDLIKAANKAMVELGDNAERIPELMDVARKATYVFGGDALERFEALSSAVASGNTRSLRQIGIIIDQDAAIQKYARSVGLTISELSEADKKQAILNETLTQANQKFKDVDESSLKVTNSWKELKVVGKQWVEEIVLGIQEKVGPAIESMIKSSIGLIKALRGTSSQELEQINKDFEEARAKEWAKAQGKNVEESPAVKRDAGDQEKILERRSKFEADMLNLRQQRLNSEINLAQSIDEVDRIRTEQKSAIEEQFNQRALELQAQVNQGKIHQSEADRIMNEQWLITNAQLKNLDKELLDARLRSLDMYQQASVSTSDGIVRAFQAGAQRNAMELQNFGKLGQSVYSSFQKHAVSSLQQLGAGTKSATDVMKGFFFNMLADQAEQYGQFMMLSGIWPPNPAAIAAGAALIALSGFLRSQAGGASAGGGAGAAGAGGASAGGFNSTQSPTMTEEERQKKAVNIVVQGSWFDSGETARRITELVRESADATDFKVSSIGAR